MGKPILQSSGCQTRLNASIWTQQISALHWGKQFCKTLDGVFENSGRFHGVFEKVYHGGVLLCACIMRSPLLEMARNCFPYPSLQVGLFGEEIVASFMLLRPETLQHPKNASIMSYSKRCMEECYDATNNYVELSGALIKREFRKRDDVKRGAVLRMFWLLKFG